MSRGRYVFRKRSYAIPSGLFQAVSAGLFCSVFIGCNTGLSNESKQPTRRPTLDSSITNPAVDGEAIVPAAIDQNTVQAAVAIRATTATFCCNALEIRFEVDTTGPVTDVQIYAWDFGDGKAGSGPTVVHTYKWEGTYDVTLTAALKDGILLTSKKSISLPFAIGGDSTITPPPTEPPPIIGPASDPGNATTDSVVASAGPDQLVSAGAFVQLNGSNSVHSGTGALTYSWREVTKSGVLLNDPNTATPTFTAPTLVKNVERLMFELTVSNGQTFDVDSVVVDVEPAPAGSDTNNVHIEYLLGPQGDTAPGTYEISWRFTGNAPISNVYLSRDCCECQNIDGSILTPDSSGVYTSTVDVPADRTVWYFVRYQHEGVEYTSRSVHVNTAPGDSSAQQPIVIWYHLWRFDLNILADALASGVVTHVMIDGGDREGAFHQDASVRQAIAMCQAKGVKTIWSVNLWNHFSNLPTLNDTFDPNYYITVMEQINADATALGADYSAMDCEAYLGVPFDKMFEDVLPPSLFDAMSAAIVAAAEQVQVDFVYPAGAPHAPLFVNNVYRPLGRSRIAESTYYDSPFKICRIDFPFEVFGAYVQPTTERPAKPENPFFLLQDILARRYHWSKADGALGNTNGLWLYTGPVEAEARATAKLLRQFSNSP